MTYLRQICTVLTRADNFNCALVSSVAGTSSKNSSSSFLFNEFPLYPNNEPILNPIVNGSGQNAHEQYP